MSEPSSRDWLVTGGIVIGLIGGAWLWRWKQAVPAELQPPPPQSAKTVDPKPLLRTRQLVKQKLGSLEAYNQEIPQTAQLREFSYWAGERKVDPEAFTMMSRLIVDRVVPDLWREAQKVVGDSQLVSLHAMSKVIHSHWPQQLLPNGHVVLFPGNPRLRMVASEVRQDYFRDTGWHWRWIEQAIDRWSQEDLEKIGELDIYAAEEFSEFLSVLAVGILEWSDRLHQPPFPPGDEINATVMGLTLALMQTYAKTSSDAAERASVFYSALTREAVLNEVPQPMFKDATQQLGLNFQHAPAPDLQRIRSKLVTPTGIAGGGVSAGDFDGDGFTDLYFAGDGGGQLWRNAGGKRFKDFSLAAGLAREGETRSGYFVDYDNDGDLDLFLTFVFRSNRLFRNEGGGKFLDVTDFTGIAGGRLVTHEAVWFDFDNDGLLDVYIANFGMWPNGDTPNLTIRNSSAPPNQFYHQKVVGGVHIFEEIGAKLGVDDRGWTHCVGAWDFDQDGWMDLISLNDFGRTIVYRNDGGKRFVEETRTLHLDTVYNAMNFHLIDLEQNGHPAVYVTEISKLTHRVRYPKPVQGTKVKFDHLDNMRALVVNKLLRRVPSGAFENVHDIHIEPAQLGWAWDASTFDYENDGDLDLLVLNGTEGTLPSSGTKDEKVIKSHEFLTRHANQNNVCFLSQARYFYNVSDKCELAYKGNSRGSAWFDFDNDGDMDVAISDYDDPGRIFENVQDAGNHWIRFQLVGTQSNHDAIGARVEIQFGDGQKRFSQVVSGKGFLSQNPMVLHFGLGKTTEVDTGIITWPTGLQQTLKRLPAGKTHIIHEPTQ